MRLKLILFFLFLLLALSFFGVPFAVAQDTSATLSLSPDEFFLAKVIAITDEGQTHINGYDYPFQVVRVNMLNGPDKGREIEINHGGDNIIRPEERVAVGEKVIVMKTSGVPELAAIGGDKPLYTIWDKYRLPALGIMAGVFFVLVLLVGRLKGLGSMAGLVVSILVIVTFIIPRIVDGKSPFWTCFWGALAIASVSLYLAHGFNRRTSIAFLSTLITLALSFVMAFLFVYMAKLLGIGSEEAYSLQFGALNVIDFRGLLLGGIIIGVLGVLDDVTTGQTAAVYQIKEANHALSFGELYQRALAVGREHVSSLVNTLALAYVGVSLPLFLLFWSNQTQPLWVMVNNELIADEIVRTLVGSIALIFAVPITTALAAYFFTRGARNQTMTA